MFRPDDVSCHQTQISPSPMGEGRGFAGNSSGMPLANETVARGSGTRALQVEEIRHNTLICRILPL